MLQVTIRDDKGELKPLEFDAQAVEVIDGALIILTDDAKFFVAGFAPGQWVTFQNMSLG